MLDVQFSKLNRVRKQSPDSSDRRAPDWSVIPSKGMARFSEEEFICKIQQLAAEDAKTLILQDETKFRTIKTQKEVLCAQYISQVSPDRQKMYQKAVENTCGLSFISPKTPIELLFEKEGIHISLVGSQISRIESSGQLVLEHNTAGWSYQKTPEETRKQTEFHQMYHGAYDAAKRAMGIQSNFSAFKIT